jgi:hypothetical protein
MVHRPFHGCLVSFFYTWIRFVRERGNEIRNNKVESGVLSLLHLHIVVCLCVSDRQFAAGFAGQYDVNIEGNLTGSQSVSAEQFWKFYDIIL